MVKECVRMWDTVPAQIQNDPWLGWVRAAITGDYYMSNVLGHWLGLGLPQPTPRFVLRTHVSPFYSSNTCFWGEGAGAGWRRNSTWKEWSQLGPDSQGFCSSNLGPDSTPNRKGLPTKKRNPSSYLFSSRPSICSPMSYQTDCCQHHLWKDMTCAQVRSSSMTYIVYIVMPPHKDTPLRLEELTFLPNFIGTEKKLSKKEKTKESISI